MSNEDYRERFIEQLSSSYGQMESVLGADGYKVFIEDHKADQSRMIAFADRQKALAGTIRILGLTSFLLAIPVIVFLWKWALSY
jgi:hypothetical protein